MHCYIVIPVHNRCELTYRCLESLQQQDAAAFSVIVVDDGSTDGTADMIQREFPDVLLLQGDGNLWWVGAINKGIRHALAMGNPGDAVVTLNDDLVVRPDYVSALSRAAAAHPGAIIGSVETLQIAPNTIKSGGIRVNWKSAKRRVLNKGEPLDAFPAGHCEKVDRLTGRGTLYPFPILAEVGLFDETHFKQCGDTELPMRASLKHGYPLLVSYDAVVISSAQGRHGINFQEYYTLSDFHEYFFGLKSHFNLRDKYWVARNAAPDRRWFWRYFLLTAGRTIGRYVTRLRLRPLAPDR